MYAEKFLQQVYRKICEKGISNAKLRETCIDIYESETEIFKIDIKGSMFYSSDKQFRNLVDKLHETIQPIVNILLPKCKKEIEKESALSLVVSQIILEVINRKMNGYRVNKLLEIFIPQMKEYNSKIFGGMLQEVIVAAEWKRPTEYAPNSEEEKLEIFQIISNELKIPNDKYVDVDW